jgi:hypothetical protein
MNWLILALNYNEIPGVKFERVNSLPVSLLNDLLATVANTMEMPKLKSPCQRARWLLQYFEFKYPSKDIIGTARNE